MQDWQFAHNIQQVNTDQDYSYTVAVDMPSKKFLLTKVLTPFGNKKFGTSLGVAVLHPEDQYTKKVGRSVATQKAKSIELEVTSINFVPNVDPHKNKIIVTVVDNTVDPTIYMKIAVRNDKDLPHLIDAYIIKKDIYAK